MHIAADMLYTNLNLVSYPCIISLKFISFIIFIVKGFVLNAIHGREGCYTYVKEIVKGESYIVLGQEEKEALRQAVNYFSDMA